MQWNVEFTGLAHLKWLVIKKTNIVGFPPSVQDYFVIEHFADF